MLQHHGYQAVAVLKSFPMSPLMHMWVIKSERQHVLSLFILPILSPRGHTLARSILTLAPTMLPRHLNVI